MGAEVIDEDVESVAIELAKHEGVTWDLAVGTRGVVRLKFRSLARCAIAAVRKLDQAKP